MNLKKHQPILEVLIISVLIYLMHKTFFFLNKNNLNFQNFHFPIETIYGFFLICSLIIMYILILVKEKNIDNVGYTFLLVTFIKMGVSYLVLSSILQSRNLSMRIEKLNFFIIFALFLAIETFITIRILNKKQ
jgi:hypothetical protein